jgi:hypothetical protein
MPKIFGAFSVKWGAVIAALFTAVLISPPRAEAQNLVQNPDFFNGLTGYTTSADTFQNVNATDFPGGPTNPTAGGTNAAVGIVSTAGDDATIAQSLTTAPNTLYMVTFAYAIDPSTADSFTVAFGNAHHTYTTSTSDGSNPFEVVTFMARSGTGRSTTLTFDGSEGGFAVSELDVEAAPAPVCGGGIASASVMLAGWAVRRRRGRA